MSKLKKFLILFAVYWFLVFTPFWIDGLNQLTPIFFGMPFTLWSFHLVTIGGCLLLIWGAKNAWDSFDDYNTEDESEAKK